MDDEKIQIGINDFFKKFILLIKTKIICQGGDQSKLQNNLHLTNTKVVLFLEGTGHNITKVFPGVIKRL